MLRLANSNDENRDAWSALPAVADYQATGQLKPAAMALLNVETSTGSQPLLVTQPYGRGHVYVVVADGEVGDHPQPRSRRQQLVVDAIGQQRDQRVGRGDRREQLRATAMPARSGRSQRA